MKFYLSIAIAVISAFALVFTGCENVTVSTGDGSEKVVGNGKVSSEYKEIKPFRYIKLNGVFSVVLKQGEKEALRIDTDENIQSYIVSTVVNDTLILTMKENVSIDKMKKIEVFITVNNLERLENRGVGELTCDGVLKLNELNVICEGVGATALNLHADKLTIDSKVVGSLTLKGTVTNAVINHSGMGIIDAFDLKTESMNLTADGVGAANIFASKQLKINASGLGNINYKGGAHEKDIRAEGLGKVMEVKED